MGHQENASPTMRMYGSQQRLWRQRAGISRQRLGEECGYSEETVKSVEVARRLVPPRMVQVAEDLCGAGGLLQDAADKIVRSKYPDWFEDYVQYEAEAASLGMYENQVVPGLFQTEEYARAVFLSVYPRLSSDEVERRTAARIERQQVLCRTPPPMASAVVEEVILQRPIGGQQVKKRQLERLLEIADMRHVEIQVMPTQRESHAALHGPMYLIDTRDQQRVVYSELQRGSALLTDAQEVSELNWQYAMLRSQAMTPEDSETLIRKTLGEL